MCCVICFILVSIINFYISPNVIEIVCANFKIFSLLSGVYSSLSLTTEASALERWSQSTVCLLLGSGYESMRKWCTFYLNQTESSYD